MEVQVPRDALKDQRETGLLSSLKPLCSPEQGNAVLPGRTHREPIARAKEKAKEKQDMDSQGHS